MISRDFHIHLVLQTGEVARNYCTRLLTNTLADVIAAFKCHLACSDGPLS